VSGPFLSIVVPTSRIGGLDVLCDSLEKSTFKDFELIISDMLFQRRRETVRKLASRYSFQVVHVEPLNNPFPVLSYCRTSNSGIMHARGEVVVFFADYTWVGPRVLEAHALFHRTQPDERVALMCPHDYITYPSPPFHYENDEIDRYVDDLKAGRLDHYDWSIGDLGEPSTFVRDPKWGGADPKNRMGAGPIGPNYFHAKNESIKLEALLKVNGWDEEFDGTTPYQDADLAGRLTYQLGVTWTLDPTPAVQIANPRPFFPFPKRLYPTERNEALWRSREVQSYTDTANPKWSLRQMREYLLGVPVP
jgi:hypothetical protein